MMQFDPYHKWLGIPPEEQPPNHYRLLGIALFEDDRDVIEAAADQRMAFVQQMATGPHVEASQKLLNELARARICLLGPDRAAYDAQLRARGPLRPADDERSDTTDQREMNISAGDYAELVKHAKPPLIDSRRRVTRDASQTSRNRAAVVIVAIFVGMMLAAGVASHLLDDRDPHAAALAPNTVARSNFAPQDAWASRVEPAATARESVSDTDGLDSLSEADAVAPPLPSDQERPNPPALLEPRGQLVASQPSEMEPVGDSMDIIGKFAGAERNDNCVAMAFVWCPPGKYSTFGLIPESNAEAEYQRIGLIPLDVHIPDLPGFEGAAEMTLDVPGFWVGKYEVTQQEWTALIGSEPWRADPAVKYGEGFPATFVSWNDAVAYCHALTAREREARRLPDGWEYALPTVVHWEYAGTAGASDKILYQGYSTDLSSTSWYRSNTVEQGEDFAHPVGQKRPNPWGVHDVLGNVSELVSLELLPTAIRDIPNRIHVSGCWRQNADALAWHQRWGYSPDYRSELLGFRVALIPTANTPAGETNSLSANGLNAVLYAGNNFQREIVQRIDPAIDFVWVNDPPETEVPADGFSIRWTGWLKAPLPGDYTLTLASDDGVRLWIDDQLLIDDWTGHLLTRHRVPITLGAEPHKLRLDYFEENLGALLNLRWAMVRQFDEQVIPPHAFFLTEDAAQAAVVPMPVTPRDGQGLTRQGFLGLDFQNPVETLVDRDVDEWPGYDSIPADVGLRWSGWLLPPEVGTYELQAVADDGVRVWLDDRLVIDEWRVGEPRRSTAAVDLDRAHAIRIDYFNTARTSAICTLRWKRPGSDSIEVIPGSAFSTELPNTGAVKPNSTLPDSVESPNASQPEANDSPGAIANVWMDYANARQRNVTREVAAHLVLPPRYTRRSVYWEPVPGAARYIVEASRLFARPGSSWVRWQRAQEIALDGPEWLDPDIGDEGDDLFRWRVCTVDSDGKRGAPTEWVFFMWVNNTESWRDERPSYEALYDSAIEHIDDGERGWEIGEPAE
jgi:formylglycine-generating enzyme required for sulfatase activity